MIDSGLFSKSTIFSLDDLNNPLQEEIKFQTDSDKKVSKSTLYHMIESFIKLIFDDEKISRQQKTQAAYQFGFNTGMTFVEQQSYGYVKFFVPKANDKQVKPFLAQMKLLNNKIWPSAFSSTCKLFAIVNENASYKFDDVNFTLTKHLYGPQDKTKQYKKIVYEFAKGVLQGFLQKFDFKAQVIYNELADNKISFQIKGIQKKKKLQNR